MINSNDWENMKHMLNGFRSFANKYPDNPYWVGIYNGIEGLMSFAENRDWDLKETKFEWVNICDSMGGGAVG